MEITRNTKWQRYSDYELRADSDGNKYIMPKEGAISFIYDIEPKKENILIGVITLAEKALTDEKKEECALEFVKKYGLLGLGYGTDDEKYFPFGHKSAEPDMHLSGRDDSYKSIYSRDYAEPVKDILLFLENYKAHIDRKNNADSDDTNILKNIMFNILDEISGTRYIKKCVFCGKYFISDDQNVRTCCEGCEFATQINENVTDIRSKYPCDVLLRG